MSNWRETELTLKKILGNEIFILISLMLISIITRLLFIDFNSVGHDEPFSIFHAQMKPIEIIAALKGGNNPPLYELILHFWIKLFGISPISVRSLSLIFSVLNVYFVFLIGRKFFSLRVAVLASLLLIFSDFHIFFAHEARVYSLFSLATTISFYLLFQIIFNGPKFKYTSWLCLVYVVLIYSHYMGFIVVGLQMGVVLFYRYYNLKTIRNYFLIVLATILSYLAYLPVFLSRFQNFTQHGTWLGPVKNLGNLHHMVYVFSNWNRYIYLVIIGLFWFACWRTFYRLKMNRIIKSVLLYFVIPLFFLTAYSMFFRVPHIWSLTSKKVFIFSYLIAVLTGLVFLLIKQRNKNPKKSIIFIWFIVPFYLIFLVSFIHPLFHDRYLLFLISGFYLGIALILDEFFRKKVFYIVSVIVIVLMAFNANFKGFYNVGIAKTITSLRQLKTDSTKVIVCPNQYKKTFTYHYDKNIFGDYKNIDERLVEDKVYAVYNASNFNKLIDSTDAHVLFLDAYSNAWYPKNGILDSLRNNFEMSERIEYKDSLVLYSFERR